MEISDYDNNFIVPETQTKDYYFLDGNNKIFSISGVYYCSENKCYRRAPSDFGEKVSKIAWGLKCTPGGMLRFVTDSGSIAVRVKLKSNVKMVHMPRTGSSGIDLYIGSGINRKYKGTIIPTLDKAEYSGEAEGTHGKMTEWLVNFPLYDGVEKIEIGLKPKSNLEKADEFTIKKPILFYGSSITQGGCASRPGNCYTNILSRWLNANIINFGFSGNAKGNPKTAEYIASLDLSAFVMDYDHNATIDELIETHYNFYKIIRRKKLKLPIIIISAPDFDKDRKIFSRRRSIIFKTYQKAIQEEDSNVYFIDGETLFGSTGRDSCTVDGCHPNDLGFMRMALNIMPVLKNALKKE